jgi:hypothetical protein
MALLDSLQFGARTPAGAPQGGVPGGNSLISLMASSRFLAGNVRAACDRRCPIPAPPPNTTHTNTLPPNDAPFLPQPCLHRGADMCVPDGANGLLWQLQRLASLRGAQPRCRLASTCAEASVFPVRHPHFREHRRLPTTGPHQTPSPPPENTTTRCVLVLPFVSSCAQAHRRSRGRSLTP